MSVQPVTLSNHQEIVEFISRFDTENLVLIAPNLEFKKNLVDELALAKGTVPDDLVLRLSEFFARTVLKNRPDLEFLDKKLFQVFLRQEFDRMGLPQSDQYLVERSVEYVSVYAPILAHSRYRTIFEEYLEFDEIFKNVYADIYPMMVKVWDLVINSSYLIRQWSLGWLYQNMDSIAQNEIHVVIFKPDSLKKVEMDFFEELSHSWNIYTVLTADKKSEKSKRVNSKKIGSPLEPVTNSFKEIAGALEPVEKSFKEIAGASKPERTIAKEVASALKYETCRFKGATSELKPERNESKEFASGLSSGGELYWHKVVTPLDEFELLAKLISEKELDWSEVKIIVPKKKIEYVKSLEVFFSYYFKDFPIDNTDSEEKINFHRIRVYLDQLIKEIKIQRNEIDSDNLEISLGTAEKEFESHSEFMKHTKFLVDPSQWSQKHMLDQTKSNQRHIENSTQWNQKHLVDSKMSGDLAFSKKLNFYNFLEALTLKSTKVIQQKMVNSEYSETSDSSNLGNHEFSVRETISKSISKARDKSDGISKIHDGTKDEDKVLHQGAREGVEVELEGTVGGLMEWASRELREIPVFIELSFENWLLYLEKLLHAKLEHQLVESPLSIHFLEDVEFKAGFTYFLLGCTQQNYESSSYAYLSDLEIDKLKLDLGFNFESKEFSEQIYDDFSKLSQMEKSPEVHFLTPAYSFTADKENDAKFLNQLLQSELCLLMASEQSGFISYTEESSLNISDVNLDSDRYKKFSRDYQSASSLQRYINCPYVYFSEYVLGLKIPEELDLEPSSMLKGTLYHDSLEKYLDKTQTSTKDIENFLNANLQKKYSHWGDINALKNQIKLSALKIKNYIDSDALTKQLEGRQTLYKELDCECYLNMKTFKFSKKRTDATDIKFIGKIDRIDTNDDKIFIFDYKLSSGKSVGDWKKEFLLQMPIYGLMFIDGVLPFDGELAQLSYIVINDEFKFKNGLSINYKDPKHRLGMTLNKANSQPDFDSLKQELDVFRGLLQSTLTKIEQALLSPAPLKVDICGRCDWKDSCHASHLY